MPISKCVAMAGIVRNQYSTTYCTSTRSQIEIDIVCVFMWRLRMRMHALPSIIYMV